ncbi:hypothetical protein PEPS_25510 [Persicobacter psychrovividus]|uniref:DUF3857 domain-containing protein n=1 Tax=Persicobacter psychrovividus TaxID=387638 RepID=A0ABM7VHQ7_9BACT|nr:hypothetical protein PEPS_25510 [Persicobacter psychrovividus]
MISLNRLFFLLIFCLVSNITFANELPNLKFGKLKPAFLSKDYPELDASAEALILFDQGRQGIEYISNRGWVRTYNRYLVIRVNNESGKEWADVDLDLYGQMEQYSDRAVIKGNTYNLQNGKWVKDKLDKDHIFNDKVSDDQLRKKIRFPNVKVGSVIELKYKITSSSIAGFKTWFYQTDIPTVWSDYTVSIPDYFSFVSPNQGFLSFHTNQRDQVVGQFKFDPSEQPKIGNINVLHQTCYLVPALKPEKFSTAAVDFYQQMRVQLNSFRNPFTQMQATLLGNWKEFSYSLSTYIHFGNYYDGHSGFYKRFSAELSEGNLQCSNENLAIVYHNLSKKVKWNGESRLYAEERSPSKVVEKGLGNSADINLMLIGCLKKLGYEVSPLILSTRSHGRANISVPMIQDYNYVCALVRLPDSRASIVLDATSPLLTAGQLPFRCMSTFGQVIDDKNPSQFNIRASKGFFRTYQTTISFDLEKEQKQLAVKLKYQGLSAVQERALEIKRNEREEEETVADMLPDYEISDYHANNLNQIYKTFERQFSATQQIDDPEFLTVSLPFGLKKNEFLNEGRKVPIDFGAPIKNKYLYQIKIPEGYTIENELKPIRVIMPDKVTYFNFTPSRSPNVLTLMLEVNIGKPLYEADSFAHFKAIYDQVLNKFAEEIILTKISQ